MKFYERPATARTLVTDEQVRLLCHDIERCDWVAIDTETAAPESAGPKGALEPYAGAWLTGISVCPVSAPLGTSRPLEGFYVPVGHKRGNASQTAVQRLCAALGSSRGPHVFAHGTFDWAMLDQIGTWQRHPATVDIQVERWLQDENAIKGLKPMGAMYLDEDADKEQRELREARVSPWENQTAAKKAVRAAFPDMPVKQAIEWARRMRRDRSWADITVEEMGPYAARDATLTAQLANFLGLDPLHPSGPLMREMQVNHICADMTARGVSADWGAFEDTLALYTERRAAAGASLLAEYGLKNPGSGPQVAKVLYGKLDIPVTSWTEGGAPATDKNTLEMLYGYPVVAEILDYRHWDNAISKVHAYIKYLDASTDGRIHGMYDTTRTVTGRLSASAPNVTTIPRIDTAPEIREAFYYVPEGVERVGFDLASAELWVMAAITGDPALTQILQEGRDLHTETAKALFGRTDGRYRTLAKNCNYGIPYGAGLAQMTMYAAKSGAKPAEAKRLAYRMRDGHLQTFARQHKMSKALGARGVRDGVLPLHPPGRFRHFFSPGQPNVKPYTALNALVQGGVAEFMKDVMIAVYETEYRDQLILQVHDELVFDTEPGAGPQILKTLQAIADDVNPFKLPLTFDAKKWAKESE